MNKCLPVLLIFLCLLCGCAAGSGAENPSVPLIQNDPADSTGYYDPDSTLEAQTNGALRCYPLGRVGSMDIRLLPDGKLLLLEAGDGTTAMTLLEGPQCKILAAAQFPFSLQGAESAVQPYCSGLSCFDPVSRETLVLNDRLEVIRRIGAPQGLLGAPLLSRDGSRLYYATADTLRVLEVPSGIHRVLKHCSAAQIPMGLALGDNALVCTEADPPHRSLLICAKTGAAQYNGDGGEDICASETRFYVRRDDTLLFGAPEEPLWELLGADTSEMLFPLPGCHGAVSLSETGKGDIMLSHYDLSTGQRTAALVLPSGAQPQGFCATAQGQIWFWRFDRHYDCNTLYLWDPSASPSGDTEIYTGLHYPREAPDLEGMARCQAYARELEQRYGIAIRIFQDADDIQPQGYRLEYEYRASQTLRSLELLERSLQQYPSGFLDAASGPFEGLTVCLVSHIRGSSQWGTLDALPGIQFLDGNHAYIALAAGRGIQGAFYHQLCHLIDTVVFTRSSAYDTWQSLNPSGFQYDYSYIANQSRNSTAYLLEDRRSFVDIFSMSYPKEDRARIMEYAMLPGNADMFRAPVMQAKLKKLCIGIREAFGLENAPETFLWEQYLDRPLGK